MRKAIFLSVTLALLATSGVASAAKVKLVTHNQVSNSGALSTLKWAGCAQIGALAPCISPTENFVVAKGVTPSDATWDWNAATGVLTATGTFWTTAYVQSNPNGQAVISDKVVNLVVDTTNFTTTATAYTCIEGEFLVSVGANGCANVDLGTGPTGNFTYESSVAYNVGGNANCVQRTLGGDDTPQPPPETGNPRGLSAAAAVVPCDAVDGAFDFWTILFDDTATGGQLRLSNGIDIVLPDAAYLTFDAAPDAIDDGPFNALQGVPLTIDVLANDLVFTDPVTVTITTPPTKGTYSVTGSPGAQAGIRIQYQANVGATGTDSLVYTVANADSTTDSATVTFNLPGANGDTALTTRNHAPININVGANDVGFADPVTITITVGPDQGGSATPPASGPAATANVSYTPATQPPGTPTYTETFTYQIEDDDGLTATATVTVTVSNTVPVAGDGGLAISTTGSAPGSVTGSINVASSPAGNSLGDAPNVVTATAGATGTTSVAPGSSIVIYTPAVTFFKGTDTFDYTITDSDAGTPETDTGTVTVTIADMTPALPDLSVTTTAGTAVTRALGATLGNGSQAQHDLVVTTPAANGTCTLAGTSVTYAPTAGYTGTDSCVVTITDEDGAGQSDTGTVNITISAAAGGGGGGGSGLLPGGGGGALDAWSLSLLVGVSWLHRRRREIRRGRK